MLSSTIAAYILAFCASSTLAQSGPWAQCGGQGWTGSTTCVSGWTCVASNQWYSQCVQGGGGGNPPEEPEEPEEPEPEEPGTGNPPSNNCGSANVNQLVGYGSGTTGGGSGSGVTVSSCSQFESAIANGGVIRISGTLSGCGSLRLTSDTTLLGVGGNSGFVGTSIRLRQIDNVIIRNLNFRQPPKGGDLIDIEEATYIWVDHCEFSNDGITGDKDYYDGMLDAKRASDFITISWNNFLDHWKGSLVGHSASNGGQDRGHLRVTYHHNYWNNVNSRTPSLRFGTGHIYSSCYEDIPTSGINSREGAQVLVEHTHFSNVKRAIVTDLDADEPGYAIQRNNIFDNSDTAITRAGSYSPPYSYTADPASCICSFLRSSAGPGVI